MSGGRQARWTDEELAPTFFGKGGIVSSNKIKTAPFFLYYAINDIHVPRMPATMFKGKSSLGYRGDAILEMDWVTGEITKKIEELGLTKNTIIIFSSDNGPVLDDGYADNAVALNGDHKPAGPYRGGKTSLYEGGTRVPFMIKWPGVIKPGTSGAMINQIDLIASFAQFLKIKIPPGEAPDSQDMLNALLGKTAKGRTTMVEEGYNNLAIVKGTWKYLEPTNKTPAELYDLINDIAEKNNIAAQHPEIMQQLAAELEKIKKQQ